MRKGPTVLHYFCGIPRTPGMQQGCTNTGWDVAWATKFCTLVPNSCRYSVWKLPHGTYLAPRILPSRLLEDLWTPESAPVIHHMLHHMDGDELVCLLCYCDVTSLILTL
jgi:hypothetical protein